MGLAASSRPGLAANTGKGIEPSSKRNLIQMEIKNGYLLITDITGYTEFLVDSELLHPKEILDTLLATGINANRAPIRALNTQGDAIGLCGG